MTSDNNASSKGGGTKKSLIIIVVILVVVIAIAAVAYGALAPGASSQIAVQPSSSSSIAASASNVDATSNDSAGSEEKTEAPDFSMTTIDGAVVQLDDFKGRPIVLNFWASTCGPCREEMPEFQKAFESYGNEVDFIMVNIPDFNGETRQNAIELVEENEFTFPIYFDDNSEASIQYGVTSIPRTYFISSEGYVEAYAPGAINATYLEQGIGMIL